MLRLGFPSDFQTSAVLDALVATELVAMRGKVVSVADPLLSEVVEMPNIELPQLVLDGALDVALTSTDRVRDSGIVEERRLTPRRFGGWQELGGLPFDQRDLLVWGVREGEGSRLGSSASEDLLDALTGPSATGTPPSGTSIERLVCLTTHAAIAAEELERHGVHAEIRYSPSPWQALASAGDGYCALALWNGETSSLPGVGILPVPPVDTARIVAVANTVSFHSEVKGSAVRAILRRIRRLNDASTTAVVQFKIPTDSLASLRELPNIVHLRVIEQPRQRAAVSVTAFVGLGHVDEFMDSLATLGGAGIVRLKAAKLDLGGKFVRG